MTGTELQIIPPLHAEITGSTAERLPEVHTNAATDLDLLAVWLKSHADGSHHTRRAYERIGRRFVEALRAGGRSLKRATVEDVQAALEAMRNKADGTAGSAATVNTYVAAVKALLGFAHKVGFTRFNAAPLIRLRKAPRKTAHGSSPRSSCTSCSAPRGRGAIGSCWRLLIWRAARLGTGKPHLVAGHSARDRRSPARHRRQGRQAPQHPHPG